MDLKSGLPFWAIRNGLMAAYPRLQRDLRCDVLILGAGITGALIAERFSKVGLTVCVAERREAGWGSTCASTALLQYETDVEMQELAAQYGLPAASLVYGACHDAVGSLLTLARSLPGLDCQKAQSLYLASHWYHRQRLLNEGALRRRLGFQVKTLPRAELWARFGIAAPAALLSAQAAQLDPYQMVHKLLRRVRHRGSAVHDHTEIVEFKSHARGVRAVTDQGCRIDAAYLVVAAGYEGTRYVDQQLAQNRSSYAYITDVQTASLGAFRNTLIWESARPYLYVRSTGDRRILVGGQDDAVDIPLKRDMKVVSKSKSLHAAAKKWLPHLDLQPAFAWAGTFAETADGLPYFGSHPQHGPRVLFALAFGGNGITYSQIGSALLLAIVQRQAAHPCSRLFSFERLHS